MSALDTVIDREIARRNAEAAERDTYERSVIPMRVSACAYALNESVSADLYSALHDAGLVFDHRLDPVLEIDWQTVALFEYGGHGFELEYTPGLEPQWRIARDGEPGKALRSSELDSTIFQWLIEARQEVLRHDPDSTP